MEPQGCRRDTAARGAGKKSRSRSLGCQTEARRLARVPTSTQTGETETVGRKDRKYDLALMKQEMEEADGPKLVFVCT